MQKSYDIQHLKKCGGTTNFDFQDFYATACRRTQADSDDRLAPVPGRGCDLHRVIDCGLIGIRERRVADMQPAAIGTGEGGGDAREGAQGVADCRPACCHTRLRHPCAQDLDGRGQAMTEMKRCPSARANLQGGRWVGDRAQT